MASLLQPPPSEAASKRKKKKQRWRARKVKDDEAEATVPRTPEASALQCAAAPTTTFFFSSADTFASGLGAAGLVPWTGDAPAADADSVRWSTESSVSDSGSVYSLSASPSDCWSSVASRRGSWSSATSSASPTSTRRAFRARALEIIACCNELKTYRNAAGGKMGCVRFACDPDESYYITASGVASWDALGDELLAAWDSPVFHRRAAVAAVLGLAFE